MAAEQTLEETAFDRFLAVAREKSFPQKLLLVFAEKELRPGAEIVPEDSQADDDFSVNPLMYVDKLVDELVDFGCLLDESLKNGRAWDLLYVTVANTDQISQSQINQRLEVMVKLIHQGETEQLLIFNALGELAHLSKVVEQ